MEDLELSETRAVRVDKALRAPEDPCLLSDDL
jgi:hypothetical protein